MYFLKKISHIISTLVRRVYQTILYCFADKHKLIVVNAYLVRTKNKYNFNLGDDLNYYLLKELTGKKIFSYNDLLIPHVQNFLCIGSILESNVNNSSIVWGSGAMYGKEKLHSIPKKVYSVRGPLTRKYLLSQGIDCPEVYGDPALLTSLIYKPQVSKKYKLGIIPHYIDFNTSIVQDLISQTALDPTIKIIKMQGFEHWHDVIDEINECDFIISSSLHGLILSDTYDIPNCWVQFSEKIGGGTFKYRDYYLSVGKKIETPIILQNLNFLKDIIRLKKHWNPISIDKKKIMAVCPFPLTINKAN